MSNIIGIDLGTTNSLAAFFSDGKPQLVPNAHGEFLTPSVVGILPTGEVLVGAAAKEYRVTHPDSCAWCFKRDMGTKRTAKLGDREFTSTELSSLVLKSLKEDAEKWIGEDVDEAVITVPAYFNDIQRKATRRAGELAGLKVRRIINEPTAAALVYGFHDRDAEKHLCVIDLGGGTFDVTIMEVFEGTLEIISTAGESMLGGEDFTDRLMSVTLRNLNLQLELVEVKEPLRASRLRQECDVAKQEITAKNEATIRVPEADGTFADEAKTLRLDAAKFAKVVEPLMDRIRLPIDKALRDADRGPDEIDEVILVGGATRMPVMVDFVRDYFQKEPHIEFNPDEVVGLGASVQAALVENDEAVDDMVMTDVCPFTLGVEIAKDFGGQTMTGYFSPVIHRNTTIPVSREEIYCTMVTNQPEILISIYQGESRKVSDNLQLGELRIEGLPPAPAGMPVHVRFSYDLNGILEVEAIVPETGKRFQTVLTNHAQDMSDDEVAAAIEALQSVKFYPRDELRNQRLLRYAERQVGEMNRFHRQSLEEAIDVFEQSLNAGSREFFEHARNGLLVLLSNLGVPYDNKSEIEE